MVELILISDNLEDEKKVINSNKVDDFYFHFVDSNSKYTKKEAYTLKTDWGAKAEPFIIIKVNDKVIKCFYSESTNKVIDESLEFIKSLKETYD